MKVIFTCLVLVLLSSCSTTKLVEHWQDESFSRNNLNNILIVAVTINQTNRLLFENSIELAMREGGLNGITSLNAIGDEFPAKETVEDYIQTHEIDYVIATKLANLNVEKDYVPASVRNYYIGPYYPRYGSYYGAGNTVTMVREAYVDTKTTAVLVTTIFDTKTGKPVWVGRTEAFEAQSSVHQLAKKIARSIWRNIDS